MIVPDIIEPFVGWRVWRVVPAGRDLKLASLYHDERWPQQSAFTMTPCENTGLAVPCPPGGCDSRHSCGVHAAKTVELACQYLPDRLRERRFEPVPLLPSTGLVYGEVCLWGEVEEAEFSFRGQFAYPHRIVVPVSLQVAGYDAAGAAQTLRDGYGVPVALARYVAELEAA